MLNKMYKIDSPLRPLLRRGKRPTERALKSHLDTTGTVWTPNSREPSAQDFRYVQ